MPSHDQSRTSQGGGRQPGPRSSAAPTVSGPLTPDQLARWAEVIADGECGLPRGLNKAQEQQLRDLVRRRLRQRLVQFIARQIARDIQRTAGSQKGRQHHAAARL
jgi:UDP:flavonoid glycosyltransferase YjiC (YdhE family)